MTLKELMTLQAAFDSQHGGRYRWGETITQESVDRLDHSIVCLTAELGEVASLVKKVNRGDTTLNEARPAIEEEISDVLIYLIQLANQLDVDLEEVFRRRLRYNWERFQPYELPRPRTVP